MANPRSAETRENTTRQNEVTWRPANDLPELEPMPGFVGRWVRVSTLGQADVRNMSNSSREGWVPCTPEDQPRLAALLIRDPRTEGTSAHGNLEMGGLMACKIPVEMAEARANYFRDQTRAQTNAVEQNYLRENDPRMPVFAKQKSRVSFGPDS